jgi:hypothetical protein
LEELEPYQPVAGTVEPLEVTRHWYPTERAEVEAHLMFV